MLYGTYILCKIHSSQLKIRSSQHTTEVSQWPTYWKWRAVWIQKICRVSLILYINIVFKLLANIFNLHLNTSFVFQCNCFPCHVFPYAYVICRLYGKVIFKLYILRSRASPPLQLTLEIKNFANPNLLI